MVKVKVKVKVKKCTKVKASASAKAKPRVRNSTGAKSKPDQAPKPKPKPKTKTKAKGKAGVKIERERAQYTKRDKNGVLKKHSILLPLTVTQARTFCHGEFPSINGKTHKYPAPSNTKAWTALVNDAFRFKNSEIAAFKAGLPKPTHPKRVQYEYVLYHMHKPQVQRRCTRNNHRHAHGLGVGDKRVVHHHNQKTMAFDDTVILTRCQHKKIHGKECVNGNS
jgi:hypothetical protein